MHNDLCHRMTAHFFQLNVTAHKSDNNSQSPRRRRRRTQVSSHRLSRTGWGRALGNTVPSRFRESRGAVSSYAWSGTHISTVTSASILVPCIPCSRRKYSNSHRHSHAVRSSSGTCRNHLWEGPPRLLLMPCRPFRPATLVFTPTSRFIATAALAWCFLPRSLGASGMYEKGCIPLDPVRKTSPFAPFLPLNWSP